MPETTKTKILCILVTLSSAIYIFVGGFYVLGGLFHLFMITEYAYLAFIAALLGAFGFETSSSLHKQKKWAWLATFIINAVIVFWSIFELIRSKVSLLLITLVLSGTILSLLFSDKKTFFGDRASA